MGPSKAWALRRVSQVILADVRDRLTGRGSVRPGAVPRSPAEIGPEWLTAAISRGTPEARVASVAVVDRSCGTTCRQRLEITYEDAGAEARFPTRLFVKCTTTLAQRLMLGLGGMIDREPGFYTQVRPSLEIEAPIGYFAQTDPRSWRSIVVLEDVVSTRSANFWTPSTKISREAIEHLLANAAAWHGALWDSPRLAELPWLKTPADQMRVIESLISLADRTPAGTRRAGRAIPAPLRGRRAALYTGMCRSMELLTRGPHTYVHGDLHAANTYRTKDGRMGVCDWQVALRGSWAHDIAYLLATALSVKQRRDWENDLLDGYLDELAHAGGARLDRRQAWLAYRRAMLYPYFAWVYTLGRARLQPRFQRPEVSLVMVERIATAIADLGSLAAVGV